MADYGLKYLCEYRSKMRGRLLYRIEIEERGAVALTDATALRMRPYSDVFTLKWGNADDPEYTAVKGSSLTLKILCVDDMEYLALFSVDPLKFRVTIYEYRTDTSGTEQRLMLWRGFLSASSYKETFAAPPYVVTLSATDGFALLDSMPFRDASGVKFSGRASLLSLLTSCMEALGIDLPVSEWVSIDGAGGVERTLKNIYVDQPRIYDMSEDISWKSVLELAVKPFLGQIFQAGGVIHVRRIGSLAGTFRPASFQTNEQQLGLDRPRILSLWEERCDIRNSAELEILPPYKRATLSVEDSDFDGKSSEYYEKDRWRLDVINTYPHTEFYSYNNRVAFIHEQSEYGPSRLLLADDYEIGVATDIEIGGTVGSLDSSYSVHVKVNVVLAKNYQNGQDQYYWDSTSESWKHYDAGAYYPTVAFDIEPSDGQGGLLSYFTASSKLNSHSWSARVTNLPYEYIEQGYKLFLDLGFYVKPPNDSKIKTSIVLSDVKVDYRTDINGADLSNQTRQITLTNFENCSWTVPMRDAGYHINARHVLHRVFVDSDSSPISSWIAPSERGDLLSISVDAVCSLRTAVSRQISGELRCRRTVDLNSLFEDGRFTRAVYYLNSLELLAARQVYKVQLRELQSLDRMLPAGVLTPVRTFDEPMALVCSLYGSLFFRTGTGPYGVAIYNTENDELRHLDYASDSLAIRKGLSAVVIQVGTTDLYAVDNLGSVLSHLDAGPSSVLNFATALYDGDRRSWVSYTADAATSKTDVTIFTRNLELESKNDMAVVATGMMLISNGYVLQEADGSTWWHNYELHPAETIEASSRKVLAVSDSLLVTRSSASSGARSELEVRRRTGQMFDADFVLNADNLLEIFVTDYTALCNCAVVAIRFVDFQRTKNVVKYVDARTGASGELLFDERVDIALCGDRIYVQQGQELFGLRMDDTRQVTYTLMLDYESGDLTQQVGPEGYDQGFSVDVVTNGTPYVVASDARLAVSLTVREYTSSLDLQIPANATSLAVDYDPVVVGIYEDPTLTRRLFIRQQGGERKVFIDCSQGPFQLDYDQNINLVVKRGEENLVNKTVSRVDFDNHVATFTFSQIEEILGVSLADHVGDTLMYYSQTYWAGAGAEIPAEGDIRILLQ